MREKNNKAFMMLDSDKWITKWTGAIGFSSCFCSQGQQGVLSEAVTKITPSWLCALYSSGPKKGAFTKIKQDLPKSF